jgi:uncharacterized protein HemX
MKNVIKLLFVVFAGLFVYIVFIKKESFNTNTVKQASSEALEKAKELAANREKILNDAQQELKHAQQKIDELEKKVKDGKAKADDVQKKISDLNEKRKALQTQMDSLKTAGEALFNDTKRNVDDALNALKKAEEDIKK